VLALKQKAQPTLAASLEFAPVERTLKPAPNLRVKISLEVQSVLDELINRCGQSPETIIAEALFMYHQSLIAPATENTPAPVVTPSTKRERRANSATEPQMQPSLLSPSLFGSH